MPHIVSLAQHSNGVVCFHDWLGRRLWGIFNSAGLFDGTIQTRLLTNVDYSESWYGYERIQDFKSLSQSGRASEVDVSTFVSEQELLAAAGRYFYSIAGYAFIGRRRLDV